MPAYGGTARIQGNIIKVVQARKQTYPGKSGYTGDEINYYLGLEQFIFADPEGIETRNYFEMIDCSLLEEIAPKRVSIIRPLVQ